MKKVVISILQEKKSPIELVFSILQIKSTINMHTSESCYLKIGELWGKKIWQNAAGLGVHGETLKLSCNLTNLVNKDHLKTDSFT